MPALRKRAWVYSRRAAASSLVSIVSPLPPILVAPTSRSEGASEPELGATASRDIHGARRADMIQRAKQLRQILRGVDPGLEHLPGWCEPVKDPSLAIADDPVDVSFKVLLTV